MIDSMADFFTTMEPDMREGMAKAIQKHLPHCIRAIYGHIHIYIYIYTYTFS